MLGAVGSIRLKGSRTRSGAQNTGVGSTPPRLGRHDGSLLLMLRMSWEACPWIEHPWVVATASAAAATPAAAAASTTTARVGVGHDGVGVGSAGVVATVAGATSRSRSTLSTSLRENAVAACR